MSGSGTYATEKEARKAEARNEAGIEEPKLEQPKLVVRGRQKLGPFALEVLEARITKNLCAIEGASRDVSTKRPTFHVADVRMMELSSDDQMKASLWVLLGTGI